MKIIDLLNKIANGEEVPKKIRIDHWGYKFEWKDYAGNYIDEQVDMDLMSCLSCDKEELNYEVHELGEKGLPEKLKWNEKSQHNVVTDNTKKTLEHLLSRSEQLKKSINEIIDYLEKQKKGE